MTIMLFFAAGLAVGMFFMENNVFIFL